MRWFVYIDEKVYGPYSPEQLTPFIREETYVVREGQEMWVHANEDPQLKDVLAGKVQPSLEWFVGKTSKAMNGPFTRSALNTMIERHEIGPADLIRHQDWTECVPLGETKLYAKWKDPHADTDDLSPREIRNAPRAAGDTPAPPSRWRQWITRARSAEMPRGGWILVSIAVLAVAVYGYFLFWGSPSTGPAHYEIVARCGGTPAANCLADARSKCICEEKPRLCGCSIKQEWGVCKMGTCQAYGAMKNSSPAAGR